MPTYEYRREDGSTFEIEQRITEDALTECPTTGQKVKRLISGGAGLVFKGSGFYQTDYVRKSGSPESKPKESEPSSSSADSSSDPSSNSSSNSPVKTESGAKSGSNGKSSDK